MYWTQFQIEFLLFWTLNFFANLDKPYINNVHNFPLNFQSSGYSIFLQIMTFRTYNVRNFPLNFRSSGHSIFLQIQTFRTYNVHNFRLNLCKSGYAIFLPILTFRTYNIHNFSLNFLQIWTFNFSANPDILYM